jgi:choline dehydrogenase-like flavoprotein
MRDPSQAGYDAIIVGSGFGGAMAAHALVEAGARVVMLERGGWVERGASSWHPTRGFFQQTPHYRAREGICACVGGASVFYGGASFRFRVADFEADPVIAGASGARWPIGYEALEPYYAEAERLLGVAGEAGVDPTEPPRNDPYPHEPAPLAPVSRRIEAAAERLGLRPFRVPLALNRVSGERSACEECITCDGYACRIGAKNDLAAAVLPRLVSTGRLEIRDRALVTRLLERGGRIREVRGFDSSGSPFSLAGNRVILAAGALASPQLLLASGLQRLHGESHVVGRYLMRHCNAFVYGVFSRPPNGADVHHKQVAVNDFYLGDDRADAPPGKLGNIQQVMHPQLGGLLGIFPPVLWGLHRMADPVERWVIERALAGVRHVTGLQVIAEDQPRARNRVDIDHARTDRFGLPALRVAHQYTERDLRARRALVRRAREILREAGALRFMYPHRVSTFSHAVGTVRMGTDPSTSALDPSCNFRGVENLYVVDGSFMPTSAAVNPSLTIAANALRVGTHLAEGR